MPIITVKSEKEAKRLLTATMKCAYGDPSGSTRSQGWYWRPRPLGLQLAVTDGKLAFRLDVNCQHDMAPEEEWRAPEWEALTRWVRSLGSLPVCDLANALVQLRPCPNGPTAPIQKVLDLHFADPEILSTDEASITKGWIDFNHLARLAPVLSLIEVHRDGDASAQVMLRRQGVTVTATGFVGVVMGVRPLG